MTCEAAKQTTDGEHSESHLMLNIIGVPFQDNNTCNDENVFPFPESTDALLDSLDSSMNLTDAIPTTTNTMASSTLSATPALQNSMNVLAMLWEGGVKPNLLSFKERDIFITGDTSSKVSSPNLLPPSFAATAGTTVPETFSNSEGNKDDSGFPPASSGVGSPIHVSLSENSALLTKMHVQPYIEDVDFWGLEKEEINTTTSNINGITNTMTSNTLPNTISPSSDAADSVKEEENKDDVAAEECLSVVDPQRTKLRVPLSAIEPTKALEGVVRHPSLCLLFQSGRCRQGANCYQVHVDPEIVKRLRKIVESLPCCCTFHGDCNTKLWDAQAYASQNMSINGVIVPLNRVAYTTGLSRFIMNDTQKALSTHVLCRLHGRPGGCRYGADCWYVHVCREIMEREFNFIVESNVGSSFNGSQIQISPHSSDRKGRAMTAEFQKNYSHPQQQQQQQMPLGSSPAPPFHPSAAEAMNFFMGNYRSMNVADPDNTAFQPSISPLWIVSDPNLKTPMEILSGANTLRNTGFPNTSNNNNSNSNINNNNNNNNNSLHGGVQAESMIQTVPPYARIAGIDPTVPITVESPTPGAPATAFAGPMLTANPLTSFMSVVQACCLIKPTPNGGIPTVINADSSRSAAYATIWPSQPPQPQQQQQMWNPPQYWDPSVQLSFVSSRGGVAVKGNKRKVSPK